jgi:hypothetical protein
MARHWQQPQPAACSADGSPWLETHHQFHKHAVAGLALTLHLLVLQRGAQTPRHRLPAAAEEEVKAGAGHLLKPAKALNHLHVALL